MDGQKWGSCELHEESGRRGYALFTARREFSILADDLFVTSEPRESLTQPQCREAKLSRHPFGGGSGGDWFTAVAQKGKK